MSRAATFVGTVAAALVVVTPILLAAGSEPLTAYGAIVEGALGDQRAVAETLTATTPLLLAGLAVTITLRSGLLNLGVEGQLVVGGLVAGAGGTLLPLPGPLLIVVVVVLAAAAGALWASIAGVLKAYRGVHEVITTIMLNYVAFTLSTYAVGSGGPLEGATQPRATDRIPAGAELPTIWPGTRLHLGFLLAVGLAAACWYVLFHTSLGYRFRMVGANPTAARFNGIDPRRTGVVAMASSGALAGLTGAVEVLGVHHRYVDAFSPGYGFDSIAVALLGFLDPIGVAAAAAFLGTLRAGSTLLQARAGVSRDVITVISGTVVVLAATRPYVTDTVARWRRRRRAPESVPA